MLDPRSARNATDCLAIATANAGEYPLCLGWQTCIEPLLPDLPTTVVVRGRAFRSCIAFFIDDHIGPHFVFDHEGELEDVPLGDVGFAEPLDELAELWLAAFDAWRNGRLHPGRRPLRLVGT